MSNIGHNSADRQAILQKAYRDLETMEAEIKKLNEEKNSYRQKHVKGTLQMKLGDFDAARRIFSMEGDRRDEYIDALRENFIAIGIHEQFDWIAADERIQTKNEERVKAAEESEEAETEAIKSGPIKEAK